ncbi:MAG: NAD(P)/FAD-dependent oxidoreductase [Pseudomonadota bacterium]
MLQKKPSTPRVVVLGAGFGGLAVTEGLARSSVEIKLVDRRNYHLFQPLLYQVATADLSPADIAWPIRGLLSRQKNAAVIMSEVQDIDLSAHEVICAEARIGYDYLVVATGATHSYFGNDHWAEHAPGLKRVVDATEVRRRILLAFERAELSDDPEEQARQMTFVVVGGGPTGVETAGAIAELAHHTLARDFRRISPDHARIILIEAGKRVLAAFPEDLSARAKAQLEGLGVEVRLEQMVRDIDADGVVVGEDRLPAATKIWAAGVQVNDLGRWLDVETDRAGRVAVEADMSLPGQPDVFVIGDAAKVPWKDGLSVPGIAPAAKQGGRFVAHVIADRVAGRTGSKRFEYRHRGNLATIGRNAAVIDFGWMKMSGAAAWWLWGAAHIFFLIGVRRRLFVALDWLWSYLTYSKGARLITGNTQSRPDDEREF